MINFTTSAIEELKRIIRTDYGAEISDCQANELGEKLLKLTALAIKHKLEAPEIVKRSDSAIIKINNS